MNVGKVYLVGAGCGDPELITVKGLRYLQECDVVLYDNLVPLKILEYVPLLAERISVGKRYGCHSVPQKDTNALLVQKALEGKTVVRLKGGDPFVFGRGGEEIQTLQEAGVPYEVVSGVTSSIAVPASAGIPVTHRKLSRSFHVITGHTADGETTLTEDYDVLAKLDGTLIFLMGIHNLPEITKRLMAGGKNPKTPAAMISNGTTAKERTLRSTLEALAEEGKRAEMESPAVVVIGDVADLDFSTTIPYPLKGIRIGVTGTKTITNKLYAHLQPLGAEVVEMDFSRLCPYEKNTKLEKALEQLTDYSWAVFTSINGVNSFFDYLKRISFDVRNLSRIRFAVIGSGTGEALAEKGIFADYMPERFDVETLADGLCDILGQGDKLLILRAEKGSEILTQKLDEKKKQYADVKIYDIALDQEKRKLALAQAEEMDFITFASGSGVRGYFADGGEIPKGTKAVCIGAATAKELNKFGIKDEIIAIEYTVDGLVQAILQEAEGR